MTTLFGRTALYRYEGWKYRNDLVTISRKEWINDWTRKVVWTQYFDVDMYDMRDKLVDYCERNNLRYNCEIGGWFECESNRKQYNDIQRMYNEYLDEMDRYYEEEVELA